jgi:hypothetical protein
MFYCRVTGDKPDEVRRKTVEDYYLWLEAAVELNKKLNERNGSGISDQGQRRR